MRELEKDNFIESVNNNEPVTTQQVAEFLEQVSYDYTEPLPDFLMRLGEGNKEGVTYIPNPYNEQNQDLLIIDGFLKLSQELYINDNGLEKDHEFDFKDYFCCLEIVMFYLENYNIDLKKKFMEHILKVIKGKFNLDLS